MNELKDKVQQSASSLRSQRSTVIQTVRQGENFNVQTEVVANHNHCHAITMEYFEVLRHFVVEQKLADVQECLFVPMLMSLFTKEKVLRWKNSLRAFIFDDNLIRGFDALERINNNHSKSQLPDGRLADEPIATFNGDLRISFEFVRPFIPEVEEATDPKVVYTTILEKRFIFLRPFFINRIVQRIVDVPVSSEEKDRIFEEEFAADIAKEFIGQLTFQALSENNDPIDLHLDLTLVSKYTKGVPLFVTINPTPDTPTTIKRSSVKQILITSGSEVKEASRIILHSSSLQYQTRNMDGFIYNRPKINNDIVNKDAALIYTPMDSLEMTNPKDEDYLVANLLLEHLNEYLEYYHKRLWENMSPQRLFGLLDCFIAPNSGGKSVASVVDNKIIGIVGNNLILPVASGYHLDPTFRQNASNPIDLLAHYAPTTPFAPFMLSMQTRGTYAEAVMGKCNSCEKIDESRHWRFSEVPCGDEPTAIQTISTDSRRADPGDLQVKDLPTSIINMQNAPSAPEPTGLGAALTLLGQSGAFKDLTGLNQNQLNAMQALANASQGAGDIAKVSNDMVRLAALHDTNRRSKTDLDEIDRLEDEGKITKEDARKLRNEVLSRKNKILSGSTEKPDTEDSDESNNIPIEELMDLGDDKTEFITAEEHDSMELAESRFPVDLSNNINEPSIFKNIFNASI